MGKISKMLKGAALLLGPIASEGHAQDAGGQTQGAAQIRDGSHDFDFDLGEWTTHIIRRLHPLSASQETVELTGTVNVRKLWNGLA